MKKINKVIAAMMMMAITTAMPAMAGNKHHNDKIYKKTTVVVVNNDRGGSHFNRVDKAVPRHFNNKHHAYRPDVKACTFKLNGHESHKKFETKVEHMKGVLDTKWNPRTRELTVIYDGKVTSARHIRHFMA
jgi:hypothetical protein